jgi:hypothetical protein
MEAHIVRGRFEAEGIPAFVNHENHIWANWFLSNALGGVKLHVNSTDGAIARLIWQKISDGCFEKDLEEYAGPFDKPICPRCGSEFVKEWRWGEYITLFVLWLYAIPLPYKQGQLKCKHCAHKWTSKERKPYSLPAKLTAILMLTLFYMVIIEGLVVVCKVHGLNSQCYQWI